MNFAVDFSSRGLRGEEDLRAAFCVLSEEERSSAEYLFLDNNSLTRLPRDTLQLFPRIKWMDLRHNRIRRLDNLAFPAANAGASLHLYTVLLQGNPAGPSLSRFLFKSIPSLRQCQTDADEKADSAKCEAGEIVANEEDSGIGEEDESGPGKLFERNSGKAKRIEKSSDTAECSLERSKEARIKELMREREARKDGFNILQDKTDKGRNVSEWRRTKRNKGPSSKKQRPQNVVEGAHECISGVHYHQGSI